MGITLPDDAEVRWMILRKGELAYDPDTSNYFALKQVRQWQGGGPFDGGGGGPQPASQSMTLPPPPRCRKRRWMTG